MTLVPLYKETRELVGPLSLFHTPPPPPPPCKDTARRQTATSQEESSRQKPTMLKPWSWISNMQNYEQMNFCCPGHPVYGIFVLAAQAAKENLHTSKVISLSKGSPPNGNAGTECKKEKTQTPRRIRKETVKGTQGDLQAALQLNLTTRNRSKRS